jgi:hypothetical protein
MRIPFEISDYKRPFLDIMNEFDDVMVAFQGIRGKVNRREFTVEMSYAFRVDSRDRDTAPDMETVILYVSHNKDGVFTKCELGAAADKPSKYVPLKAAISTVAAKKSNKAKEQHIDMISRPDVNVFKEIYNVLDTFKCENITYCEIRYGYKFLGLFNGVRFEFNVWTMKSGRLNVKAKKVKGVERERVNPLWDVPKAPPIPLKHKIDQVVEWVKIVEEGKLTRSQITDGPSARTIDELETEITARVRALVL